MEDERVKRGNKRGVQRPQTKDEQRKGMRRGKQRVGRRIRLARRSNECKREKDLSDKTTLEKEEG